MVKNPVKPEGYMRTRSALRAQPTCSALSQPTSGVATYREPAKPSVSRVAPVVAAVVTHITANPSPSSHELVDMFHTLSFPGLLLSDHTVTRTGRHQVARSRHHHSGRLESAHSQRGDRCGRLYTINIHGVRVVEAEGQALAEGPHYTFLIGGECDADPSPLPQPWPGQP